MTTTTIDTIEQEASPQTKRGLGTKIILLGILPVLFMAALNLGVSFKTGNLFESTLDNLNQKAENADNLMEGSISVQRSLTKVRNSLPP